MLEAKLETSKKQFEQLSVIHRKCRSQKERVSVGIQTLADDDNDVVQQNSEILMLEAEFETLKKQFEQLSDVHSKCSSQKEGVSVGIQTLADDDNDDVEVVTLAFIII